MERGKLFRTLPIVTLLLVGISVFFRHDSNIPGLWELFGFLSLLSGLFLIFLLVREKEWSLEQWIILFTVLINILFITTLGTAADPGLWYEFAILVIDATILVILYRRPLSSQVERLSTLARPEGFTPVPDFEPPAFRHRFSARPSWERNMPVSARLAEHRRNFIEKHFSTKKLSLVAQQEIAPLDPLPHMPEQEKSTSETAQETVARETFTAPGQPEYIEMDAEHPLPELLASTNGQRYHLSTCMIALRIPQEKRIVLNSSAEAAARELQPCRVCNPEKL